MNKLKRNEEPKNHVIRRTHANVPYGTTKSGKILNECHQFLILFHSWRLINGFLK